MRMARKNGCHALFAWQDEFDKMNLRHDFLLQLKTHNIGVNMSIKRCTMVLALLLAMSIFHCDGEKKKEAVNCSTQDCGDFLDFYADFAYKAFDDSLFEAKAFQNLVKNWGSTTDTTKGTTKVDAAMLKAARKQWIRMRVPYLQTEITRFSSTPVDTKSLTGGIEREPNVNAWPLTETSIDTFLGSTDLTATEAKTVANMVQAEIAKLNGKGGEDDVKIGYHAIEYLLWGTDDNNKDGKPASPHTDTYFTASGTNNDIGERRIKYLTEITKQLIDDLTAIRDAWSSKGSFVKKFKSDATASMKLILTGMGTFGKGEVGGERFNGLTNFDQEEEHSCFSDTSMQDFYYDLQGVVNLLDGSYSYERTDGKKTSASGSGLNKVDSNVADYSKKLKKVRDYFSFKNVTDPGAEGQKTTQSSLPSAVRTFAFEALTKNPTTGTVTNADEKKRLDFYTNTVQVGIVKLADDVTKVATKLGITIKPLGPGKF